MASVVEICNLALSWLGANLITSLDDDTTEAGLCKVNYPHMRDAVLESADWSFAIRRQTLPQLASQPVFGDHLYQFQLPANCLRIITASQDAMDRRRIDWRLEERKVISAAQTMYIRYIARIEDPKQYSPLFIHALAARLAADLAVPIVESRALQQQYWQMYMLKLAEAMANDSMQGKHEKIRSDSLQTVRWSHTLARYGLV